MALGKKLKLDRLIPLIDLSELEDVKSVSNQSDSITTEEIQDDTEVQVSRIDEVPSMSFLDPIDTGDLRIEFRPSKRKTQKKIFVHLSGSLTIRNVSVMKGRISTLFDEYDHIELVLKDITVIDITAVQLFNLMRVNFHTFGKYTYINAELTNEQKQLLNSCGYSEFHSQVTASV
jgi:MFS superfamily sulfate permease-like transporter